MRIMGLIPGSLFQSTLPMRGGTVLLPAGLQESPISIHPPRGRRDPLLAALPVPLLHFNPPSPWGEGPFPEPSTAGRWSDFNPPSPCGEGPVWRTPGRPPPYFNPPSPWGEGLCPWKTGRSSADFNPHSPQGEGRPERAGSPLNRYFNPPSPCGEGRPTARKTAISAYFNPPSPCGEGRVAAAAITRRP